MRAIVGLLFAASLYAAPGEKVKSSLPLAAAAEAEGRYEKALDLYLKSYLAGERTEGVREKIHDCLRLTAQTRRHRDPGFRKYVADLPPAEALNLYAEIVEKLGSHYADREKARPDKLFALSLQEIDRALADPAFRKSHIVGSIASIERVRVGLRDHWIQRLPASAKEARATMVNVVRAAQSELAVETAPLVLEAICGACAGLDDSTAWLTPQQMKEKRHEPTVVRVEIVDAVNGIGVVGIHRFRDGTPAEVDAAIARLRMEGMRSLILDLRGNAGGSFVAALALAERFVPGGILATTTGQVPEFAERAFTSASGMSAIDLPLVVLVDGRTMSAAEVFASAIKEANRGTLVGEATFGKGTVQNAVPVAENAGTLMVTIAKVFSARGAPLSAGVVPHLEEREPELQMRLALEQATRP